MSKYWAFWQRGWRAFLFMFIANISFALLCLPLAFWLNDDKGAYIVSALAMWLIVGLPLSGLLFEVFAASSKRLITQDRTPATSSVDDGTS